MPGVRGRRAQDAARRGERPGDAPRMRAAPGDPLRPSPGGLMTLIVRMDFAIMVT